MKILIFGMPRSGTSSLFNFLRKSLPATYSSSYEPFKKTTEFIWGDKCIVKTVLTESLILKEGETMIEHSNRIISNFDKIVYIKRKSIEDTIKSMSDFQQPDLPKEVSDVVAKENIESWVKVFDAVTKDKKVFYYEDIYCDVPSEELKELCEHLDIKFNLSHFNKYIHPNNKEFDEKKIKTII